MNIIRKNYKAIFLFLIILLCSCKNVKIQSLYSDNIVNNKKICLYLDINNLLSKTLMNHLKEYPYVVEYSNCDYLAVMYMTDNTMSATNMSGINLKNQFNVDVKYYLFEFDKKFTNEVMSVLQNSNIETNEKFVGRKDYYFTKQINQYGTIQPAMQTEQQILNINKTINKVQEYLLLLNSNTVQQSLMYNYNVLLPLSISQESQDAILQSAKAISEKLMNSIISDIIDKQRG